MPRVVHNRLILPLLLMAASMAAAQDVSELEVLREQVRAYREQIARQQAELDALEQRLERLLHARETETLASPVAESPAVELPAPQRAPWYERFQFRGYFQVRTNRLATTNSNLVCEICDHSIGANQNVFIRRARFVLRGDLTDRISFYFQPDFANSNGLLNFGEVRDLYADIGLDKDKQLRLRVGQAKIPYGFEVMQSSGSRITIDRSDAIDSGTPNERDLGAFLFWTPPAVRERFEYLVDSGLRGSSDFGMFAAGVYNGQGANHPEANNNMHLVARATYPWELSSGQILETSLQGYFGRYTVTPDQISAGAPAMAGNFRDHRVAASVILYPQPFGLQAEYNIGTGPQFSAAEGRIVEKPLHGGYVQAMLRKRWLGQWFIPFYRYQTYSGGMKVQEDARFTRMNSSDFGVEWQPNSYLEFTTEVDHSDRETSDFMHPHNRQKGTVLRLQMQVNY